MIYFRFNVLLFSHIIFVPCMKRSEKQTLVPCENSRNSDIYFKGEKTSRVRENTKSASELENENLKHPSSQMLLLRQGLLWCNKSLESLTICTLNHCCRHHTLPFHDNNHLFLMQQINIKSAHSISPNDPLERLKVQIWCVRISLPGISSNVWVSSLQWLLVGYSCKTKILSSRKTESNWTALHFICTTL